MGEIRKSRIKPRKVKSGHKKRLLRVKLSKLWEEEGPFLFGWFKLKQITNKTILQKRTQQ